MQDFVSEGRAAGQALLRAEISDLHHHTCTNAHTHAATAATTRPFSQGSPRRRRARAGLTMAGVTVRERREAAKNGRWMQRGATIGCE